MPRLHVVLLLVTFLVAPGALGAGLGGSDDELSDTLIDSVMSKTGGGGRELARLEREAKRDERGADREADKAIKLEKELGDSEMATKYERLEHEISDDDTVEKVQEAQSSSATFKNLEREINAEQFTQFEREIKDDNAIGNIAVVNEQLHNSLEKRVRPKPPDFKPQHHPRVAGADVIPGETTLESVVQEGEKVLSMVEDAEGTKGRSREGDGGGGESHTPRDLITEAEVEGGMLRVNARNPFNINTMKIS
jgi:hypothetical protein